ncbi:hypothetical protein [Candidatus Solirubrobacter pratensis]|uniref:hypothetical protein n=1 Tax=Candidatus Solirubrobacter pratensis TaxID=1298857 RepID=UPI00040A630E|nr:hypothetical protein [Candidatus Solirubrobacter pratensis]
MKTFGLGALRAAQLLDCEALVASRLLKLTPASRQPSQLAPLERMPVFGGVMSLESLVRECARFAVDGENLGAARPERGSEALQRFPGSVLSRREFRALGIRVSGR